MQKYRVRLALVEYSSAEIEVEAESPEQAEEKAKDEATDEDFSRHDAEQTVESVEEYTEDTLRCPNCGMAINLDLLKRQIRAIEGSDIERVEKDGITNMLEYILALSFDWQKKELDEVTVKMVFSRRNKVVE